MVKRLTPQTEVKGIPTFDIESIGWVHPIAVGFYDGNEYHEFIQENPTDDVIWRFLEYLREHCLSLKIYAHCASRYDNKFILNSLCQHDQTALPEAGLARLRWKESDILFEDSYLLVPMPLELMNKVFGTEEKGRWEHEKTVNPWEMGEELLAFRSYLKNDCISLSHSLKGVCEELGSKFGVMPSISLSTTSVKAFDKFYYGLDKIDPNEEYEEFIRKAIYGGRNEVYRRYGENINLYDVHQMYVSCYDTPVPIGKLRWVRPNLDRGTITEATVKIPKNLYIGPLPYKYKDQPPLAFPVGELTAWWDTRELKNATNYGVDVIIRRQLYCEEEAVLKGFGEFVSKLRGGTTDGFWKMFGVSLSGKLGQSRWRDTVKHIKDFKENDMEGYFPLDSEERYWQKKEYIKGRAPYIRPLIAMRVRSEARIRHLNLLNRATKTGLLYYGDTDSIYTTAEIPLGPGPGELGLIGVAERGYFVRQKLYGYIIKGKFRQRSSGYSDLKLKEEDFKALLEGKHLDIPTIDITRYKDIIKDKEVELLERIRRIRGKESDTRITEGDSTRPLILPDEEDKLKKYWY